MQLALGNDLQDILKNHPPLVGKIAGSIQPLKIHYESNYSNSTKLKNKWLTITRNDRWNVSDVYV